MDSNRISVKIATITNACLYESLINYLYPTLLKKELPQKIKELQIELKNFIVSNWDTIKFNDMTLGELVLIEHNLIEHYEEVEDYKDLYNELYELPAAAKIKSFKYGLPIERWGSIAELVAFSHLYNISVEVYNAYVLNSRGKITARITNNRLERNAILEQLFTINNNEKKCSLLYKPKQLHFDLIL